MSDLLSETPTERLEEAREYHKSRADNLLAMGYSPTSVRRFALAAAALQREIERREEGDR